MAVEPQQFSPVRPSVFGFADFRQFIRAMMDFKQSKNPSYSEAALLRQAGFAESSRGYFGLVVNGKRNLSPRSILGLAEALKLSPTETQYFEALVFYNQARSQKDKGYFLERLEKTRRGHKVEAVDLLRSQYNYFSQWYLVAIRELVGTKDFEEDPQWITRRLRRRVSARQVELALVDLLRLKILKRDGEGRLRQTEDLINFPDSSANFQVVMTVAKQLMEQAMAAVDQDAYEDRSISSVMLACQASDFAAIRNEIREFRSGILARYSRPQDQAESVFNLGIQLTHITPPGETGSKS